MSAEPSFDATVAAFAYAFPIDAMLHAFKYRARHELAPWFAGELYRRLVPPVKIDLLAPLPLHPQRLAQRGYNQSLEIAKPLARVLGLNLDPALGRRVRDTEPQTGLAWKARQANMGRAFVCERALAGLNIAVVDDVMTTGASLEAYARALKDCGAARVENWVVARTARDA